MIESSGQILTGRASEDLAAVITNRPDANGFYRSAYKALVIDSTKAAAEDSNTKGTWVKIAESTNTFDEFVGVVGDDHAPQANIDLTSQNPVCNWKTDYNVKAGDVVTFERNGIISVIAGDDITEGDYLKLGDDGTFVPETAANAYKAVGRAYETAEEGRRFRAMIRSL